jgi:hypothetical protein
MSSTTNNPYMTKSMNGIIVLSDGAGTTIEGGKVITNILEISNLNVNNIQGKLPANNITLYTNTTGNVNIADNAANIRMGDNSNITTISANTLNLKGIVDTYLDTNNDTYILSGNNINSQATNNMTMETFTGSINFNSAVDTYIITGNNCSITSYDTYITSSNNCSITSTLDTNIFSGNALNIQTTNDTTITSFNNTTILSVNDCNIDASNNLRMGDFAVTTDINGQTLNLNNTTGLNLINIGNGTGTSFMYLNSKTYTGIYSTLATGSVDIQANQVSINSGNGKTTFIGDTKITAASFTTNGATNLTIGGTATNSKVLITGGHQIEPRTPATGLKIGEDIVSANFFLGNSTYPPSCNATATTGKQICNYDTVLSMIGGATLLNSNNVWTGLNDFQQVITTPTVKPYTVGGTLILGGGSGTDNITLAATTLTCNSAATFNSFLNTNELTPRGSPVDMFLWSSAANLTNIWIGSTTNANTGIVNVSPNNGICNIANSTNRNASVNIANSVSFTGTVNLATASLGNHNVNIGRNATTTLTLRGVSTSITGTTTTINTTTLNVNSTTINIGDTSTTALNIGQQIVPTYGGYNINTGTNFTGSIGQCVTATYAGVGGNLAQNTVYVTGTISVPTNGVYIFHLVQSFTMSVAGSTNRTVVDMLVRNFAGVNQLSVGTVSVNGNQSVNNHFLSTSGMYVFTGIVAGQPWNIQSRLETGTFGGTMQLNAGNYRFTSTRIA